MSGCCSSCGFDPCKCGCGFTQLSGNEIDHTLVASLTGCVDGIRNIATCLGARPYQVVLVWTRWSGGERGAGVEEVIREEAILPTPALSIGGLRADLQSIGIDELGVVKITEISPRYNEDYLMGRAEDGRPIPEDQNFFWEINYQRASGNGMRRRFTVKSPPSYLATKFQWNIDLLKASQNRSRQGDLL